MFMILCVIDQPDHMKDVLHSWQEYGIRGVTVMESTGLHRVSKQFRIPMRYMFGSAGEEHGNITLFTVVEKEEQIQLCLKLAEAVVGNFDTPNTGIFAAWPLAFTKGVSGKQPLSSHQEDLP